jgi:hypothetical protein
MGSAVLVLFVTVTTCTGLLLPTLTEPKEIDAGERVTGRTPLPVTSCTCVLTVEELLARVTPPSVEATVVGANVTVTVQVFPAASAPPQGVAPLGATV